MEQSIILYTECFIYVRIHAYDLYTRGLPHAAKIKIKTLFLGESNSLIWSLCKCTIYTHKVLANNNNNSSFFPLPALKASQPFLHAYGKFHIIKSIALFTCTKKNSLFLNLFGQTILPTLRGTCLLRVDNALGTGYYCADNWQCLVKNNTCTGFVGCAQEEKKYMKKGLWLCGQNSKYIYLRWLIFCWLEWHRRKLQFPGVMNRIRIT